MSGKVYSVALFPSLSEGSKGKGCITMPVCACTANRRPKFLQGKITVYSPRILSMLAADSDVADIGASGNGAVNVYKLANNVNAH